MPDADDVREIVKKKRPNPIPAAIPRSAALRTISRDAWSDRAGGEQNDRRHGQRDPHPGETAGALADQQAQDDGDSRTGDRGNRRGNGDERRGQRTVQGGEPRRAADSRRGSPEEVGQRGQRLAKGQRRGHGDQEPDKLGKHENGCQRRLS